MRTVKEYDAANQLLSVVHRSSEGRLGQHVYEYDLTGRRILQKFGNGAVDKYEYDATDQLVRAVYRDGQNRNVQKFGYDAMGNRKFSDSNGERTTYQTNSVNQYVGVNATTTPPDGRWVYDKDGNLLSDGSRQFEWNHQNQLIHFTSEQGEKVQYGHDAQGRRISRTVDNQTTLYIYEGWNVINEYLITNNSSPITAHRALTWGQDLSGSYQGAGGVGGLLMVEELIAGEAVPHFYQYDANGNVTQVTDAAGNTVATYRYDGFGSTLSSSGDYAETNTYRFSTKPIDKVSGLYYYGYRYYDPVTGRWINRDPLSSKPFLDQRVEETTTNYEQLYQIFKESDISTYVFVSNNAIQNYDIKGLARGIVGPIHWKLEVDNWKVENDKYVKDGSVAAEFGPLNTLHAACSVFAGWIDGTVFVYPQGSSAKNEVDSSPCQDLEAIAELDAAADRPYQLFSSNCQHFVLEYYDAGMDEPGSGECCNPDGTVWSSN